MPGTETLGTEITDQRQAVIKRAGGTVKWTINEFNYGRAYMLVAETNSTHFHAHFDREQYREFQRLFAAPYTEEGEW